MRRGIAWLRLQPHFALCRSRDHALQGSLVQPHHNAIRQNGPRARRTLPVHVEVTHMSRTEADEPQDAAANRHDGPKQAAEDAALDDTEQAQAAQLIQRNYRGYRERRKLKGLGLDADSRWSEVRVYWSVPSPSLSLCLALMIADMRAV